MIRRRNVVICTVGMALIFVLAMGSACMDERASEAIAAGGSVPIFEVDPLWPKPLPNHWILGSTIGVSVDSRDHIWIIHRQTTFNEANELGATLDPPTTECCVPAPNILEFDMEGNLVNSWGGPGDGYDWPQSNHGITVDAMDNVWIGGNGADDSHILKFTRDGQFLMQLGQPRMRAGSNDREHFWRVAEVTIDAAENEAYVADGYGNRRIAVLDASTGAFKRYWGAYGNTPDDSPLPAYSPDAPPAQQFRSPVHCAQISHDGLVYVCDRAGDRIQVFQRDGTYVTEGFVAPETLGSRSRATRSSGSSTWPTAPIRRSTSLSARPSRCSRPSATAGVSPASSTVCTASRRTHKGICTRRRPTRASGSRSSCTWAWAPRRGTREWSGRLVIDRAA